MSAGEAPSPAPGLHPGNARSVVDHLVSRRRRIRFPAETRSFNEHTLLHRHGAQHRQLAREVMDRLLTVLEPGEAIVHVVDGSGWYPGMRKTAVTGRIVALTNRRALAVGVEWETDRSDGAPGEVVVQEAPLRDVDVDRTRLTGGDGLSFGLWTMPARFKASSKSKEVVARVKAFLDEPAPEPFPELQELLALPAVDPAQAPPDWYPDPYAGAPARRHRWWDGGRWTDESAFPGEYVPKD